MKKAKRIQKRRRLRRDQAIAHQRKLDLLAKNVVVVVSGRQLDASEFRVRETGMGPGVVVDEPYSKGTSMSISYGGEP